MSITTIGLAEAKNNFSKVTAEVNRTGRPVTVMKNNKPWVVIMPASAVRDEDDAAIDFMERVGYAVIDLAK